MIFETENYRNYFRARLSLKGLTYEDFISKHPDVISLGGFQQFISGGRNLSIQTFFKLVKPLHLKPEEAFYLYILSLENDLDPRTEGNETIIGYMKKMREHILPFLRGDYKEQTKPISPEALLFNDSLALLNKKSRSKVLESLRTELSNNIARQISPSVGRKLLVRLNQFIH